MQQESDTRSQQEIVSRRQKALWLIAVVGVAWLLGAGGEPGGVEVSRQECRWQRQEAVRDKVDVNEDSWPMVARLPGVGEKRAKDIVMYREQMKQTGAEVVFWQAEDLCRIKGIGPKTVEKMRPYLYTATK